MQTKELVLDRLRLLKTNMMLKFAIIITFLVIIGAYVLYKFSDEINHKQDYIGIVKIENIIMDNAKFDRLLDEIENSKNIKALVLDINSPGGSSGASEKIYHRLKSIRKKIPIVASLGSVAASGGYLVSLAGEKIFAMNMSITGSIGVLFQTTEVVEAASKLGIKFKNYKSSPFKAAPNPMEVATPEIEKAAMEIINDSCEYFISLVAENRKMSLEDARSVSDGRIYTGRLALKNKLIDEIGTTEDAINYIKKEHKLQDDVQAKELKPKGSIFLDAIDNMDQEVRFYYTKFMQMVSLPQFLALQ